MKQGSCKVKNKMDAKWPIIAMKALLIVVLMGVMMFGWMPNAFALEVKADEAQTYTITFEANGGYFDREESVTTKTIQVKAGETINDAPWGERQGYVLLGWKTEGDDTLYDKYGIEDYDNHSIFAYVPTRDTTFEAQWEEGYIITFKSDEGGIDEEYTIQKKDKINNLPYYEDGERLGYILKGWKVEGDSTSTIYVEDEDADNSIYEYVPTGNTTFVAQWEKGYIITFRSEDGYIDGEVNNKEAKYTIAIKEGQTLDDAFDDGLPYMGGRDGYRFQGWKIEGNDTLYKPGRYFDNSIYKYIPNGNTTFVAQWAGVYTVTYKSKEGYLSSKGRAETEITETVIIGDKIGVVHTGWFRPGYRIVSYKEEDSGKIYSTDGEDPLYLRDYVPTKNTTFIAQWEEAYSVLFYSEWGYMRGYTDEVGELENRKGPYWENIVKGEAIGFYESSVWPNNGEGGRAGYTFLGWRTRGDDKLYTYANIANYIPTKDTVFYATWKKNDSDSEEAFDNDTYTIFFYGQDEDEVHTEKVAKGSSVNITEKFWESYYGDYGFSGCKTEGDNTLYMIGEAAANNINNYVPTKDTIFYGQWDEEVTEPGDDIKTPETKDPDSKTDNINPSGDKTPEDKTPETKTPDTTTPDTKDTQTTTDPQTDNTSGYTKGTVATYNKAEYKVDSDSTVIYQKPDNKKVTAITVPATVTLNNKEYKVTAIADNAFKGCSKLKTVTIGKNVTTIGKQAFSKCTKLKKVTIGEGTTTIKAQAFNGCKNLKTVVIKSEKIKSIGSKAFKGINKKAVISVPKALNKKNLTKYKKLLKRAGVPKAVKIKKK